MKKLVMSISLLFVMTGLSFGESFIVDTTVGAYLTPTSTLLWYRDTGVTYNKLPMNLGVRISHKVYDGFALTGSSENYRITGVLFMPFDKSLSIDAKKKVRVFVALQQ